LTPNTDVSEQLSLVADELRLANNLNGSWVSSERYHMTLHHLGQFPKVRPDLVSRAIAAANKIQAQKFDITLDQFMNFDSKIGKYPCVLTSESDSLELQKFWQLLKNNLFALKLGQHVTNSFKPSVTMLYSRQPVTTTLLVKPVNWQVSDFVLIESLVGKSEHIELGRWPLSN
ncbi:MAG: 2'-5' RNA ligase family protein, partial [Arenimonas sp.]